MLNNSSRLTNENGAEDLKNCRQNTGLFHGEDLGADTGAEWVGHIVCSDAEGEHEGDDEAHNNEPEHVVHLQHIHLANTLKTAVRYKRIAIRLAAMFFSNTRKKYF